MAAGDTVFGDHEELIARIPKLLDVYKRQVVDEGAHVNKGDVIVKLSN